MMKLVTRGTGLLIAVLGLASCVASQPRNVSNVCSIFEERRAWYRAAKQSERRWGIPIALNMAFVYQESAFQARAKPERSRFLWLFPGPRPSTAYGYAQALDSTWGWYKDETGRRFADRDDFKDAIDFVGWYTHTSYKSVGISKWDPYNQYLAYHEGQNGWKRGTYRRKNWLKSTARTVDHRAREWGAQLKRCEEDLDDGWWIF